MRGAVVDCAEGEVDVETVCQDWVVEGNVDTWGLRTALWTADVGGNRKFIRGNAGCVGQEAAEFSVNRFVDLGVYRITADSATAHWVFEVGINFHLAAGTSDGCGDDWEAKSALDVHGKLGVEDWVGAGVGGERDAGLAAGNAASDLGHDSVLWVEGTGPES